MIACRPSVLIMKPVPIGWRCPSLAVAAIGRITFCNSCFAVSGIGIKLLVPFLYSITGVSRC